MSGSGFGTMTPAAEAAVAECHKLIRAVMALPGRSGTIDEIAAAAGIPRAKVQRRLLTCNASFHSAWGYFAKNKDSGLWGLSDLGYQHGGEL